MDDREYCAQALREVSRTFSQPIEALRPELATAVTCAYLLCRIADTVEDHPGLSPGGRDALFVSLLVTLEEEAPAEPFEALFSPFAEDRPDHDLCKSLGRVLVVWRELPADVREACTPWIAEMIRGMALYGHRPPGPDGLVGLHSLADLERYCYYVAGTVGHLLTELFVHALPDLEPERRRGLHRHAEEFGLGLQLVNVLKDVTDDRSRRVSYVPRDLCEEAGIGLAQMTDPARREAAHRAMAPIFARARRALDAAFDYTIAIPPEVTDVRMFCLLPLWMAGATLGVAEHNDAQLVAGAPVKISRERVYEIIAECREMAGDDDALRAAWSELRS